MTKILIVSDNHANNNIVDIASQEEFDIAVHCGDSQMPYDSEEMQLFDYKVTGNCDFSHKFPKEETITVENRKILVVHGHLNDVKFNFDELARTAKKISADLVFFGHTHKLEHFIHDGIEFINPGSTAFTRSQYPNSYCIVEVSGNLINYQFKRLDKQVIDYLE